jgi:hypothetical protein
MLDQLIAPVSSILPLLPVSSRDEKTWNFRDTLERNISDSRIGLPILIYLIIKGDLNFRTNVDSVLIWKAKTLESFK